MPADQARVKRLLTFFNLTELNWDAMERFQSGLCFICGKKQASGKRLATDHCHKTGLIRGLLCASCNRLLGKIENAILRAGLASRSQLDILERVLLYLRRPPAIEALGRQVYTFAGRLGTKRHRAALKKQKKSMPIQTTLGDNSK